MAALRSSCEHYICVLFLLLFPRLISAVADWMSTILRDTWCCPSANLECRSQMCCTRLAGNSGPKKLPKIARLGTITQLRLTTLLGYIFATKASIDNRKKPVKQQYLSHMSSQYGELRPTNGWDRFQSLEHPGKFQRLSHLGNVTARHSSSGRQPNCGIEQRAPPI